MELLSKDVDNEPLAPDNETLVVEDGNAIFYYLSQVPGNFKEIAEKIFSIMVKNHSSSSALTCTIQTR